MSKVSFRLRCLALFEPVRQDQAVRRAVAFGKGEFLPAVAQRGARVSLLLEAQLSRWQGNVEVELNVQDLRVL